MKALFESKRTRAILVIGIVAIAIGLISKKVISFQTSGYTKRGQEFTFNKEKKILYILKIFLLEP